MVNIAGMSEPIFFHSGQHRRNVIKKESFPGGQHHRIKWSRWIRIGGQDESEYTFLIIILCTSIKRLDQNHVR